MFAQRSTGLGLQKELNKKRRFERVSKFLGGAIFFLAWLMHHVLFSAGLTESLIARKKNFAAKLENRVIFSCGYIENQWNKIGEV